MHGWMDGHMDGWHMVGVQLACYLLGHAYAVVAAALSQCIGWRAMATARASRMQGR